jgi:plasmid stability protein
VGLQLADQSKVAEGGVEATRANGIHVRYEHRQLTCVAHATMLDRMSKMIQVRNVPDAVHRTLKARAAMAGMSLSDFLLAEIRQLAARPSLEEMRERLHRREPVKLKVSAAQAVREARDAR